MLNVGDFFQSTGEYKMKMNESHTDIILRFKWRSPIKEGFHNFKLTSATCFMKRFPSNLKWFGFRNKSGESQPYFVQRCWHLCQQNKKQSLDGVHHGGENFPPTWIQGNQRKENSQNLDNLDFPPSREEWPQYQWTHENLQCGEESFPAEIRVNWEHPKEWNRITSAHDCSSIEKFEDYPKVALMTSFMEWGLSFLLEVNIFLKINYTYLIVNAINLDTLFKQTMHNIKGALATSNMDRAISCLSDVRFFTEVLETDMIFCFTVCSSAEEHWYNLDIVMNASVDEGRIASLRKLRFKMCES
jgi:hypothetical protein